HAKDNRHNRPAPARTKIAAVRAGKMRLDLICVHSGLLDGSPPSCPKALCAKLRACVLYLAHGRMVDVDWVFVPRKSAVSRFHFPSNTHIPPAITPSEL